MKAKGGFSNKISGIYNMGNPLRTSLFMMYSIVYIPEQNIVRLKQKISDHSKDHIYRMVIVEGCCTMVRSSSLGANCLLVDTKV